MSTVEDHRTLDEKSVALNEDSKGGEGQDLESIIDPKEEKALLARLDLFFTPVIMLVYLSCFLDRTNIVGSTQRSCAASTDII